MIKINFIAEAVSRRRAKRIRPLLIAIYLAIWVTILTFTVGNFQTNRTIIEQHSQKLNELKEKIDTVNPQFSRAVNIYSQTKQYKKKLGQIPDVTIEPEAALGVLLAVSETIPGNFWLEEINFGQYSPSKGKATNGVKIVGNLFFEEGTNQKNQIQNFLNELKSMPVFKQTSVSLNLDKVRVHKLKGQYFHNFGVTLYWPDKIL